MLCVVYGVLYVYVVCLVLCAVYVVRCVCVLVLGDLMLRQGSGPVRGRDLFVSVRQPPPPRGADNPQPCTVIGWSSTIDQDQLRAAMLHENVISSWHLAMV